MASNFKKYLSLLLVIIMVTSMSGVSVFAEGTSAPAFTPATVVGYSSYDKETNKVDTSDTNKSSSVTEDGITVSKVIEKVNGKNNDFDITLSVSTSQTVTNNDTAVILVLDYSTSLSEQDQRTLQCAAKNFLGQLKTMDGNVCVSVVEFASKAHTVLGWTDLKTVRDVNNLTLKDRTDIGWATNTFAAFTLSGNLLAMDRVAECGNKYVVMFTDGQPTVYCDTTNRQGRDSNKYVNNTTDVYSSKDLGNFKGNAVYPSKEACDKAVAAANAVKANANIFTIYCGDSNEVCYEYEICNNCNKTLDQHTQSTRINKNKTETIYICAQDFTNKYCENTYKDGKKTYCSTCRNRYMNVKVDRENNYLTDYHTEIDGKWVCDYKVDTFSAKKASYKAIDLVNAISSENCAYPISSIGSVSSAFSAALQSIISGSTGAGWTVTDPMGQYITYASSNTIALDGNTLTWNLSNTTPKETKSGSTTTYTYTYKYRVTLETGANGFVTDAKYPTNGRTVLNHDGETIDFNIPVVKGTVPQVGYTIKYQKRDGSGEYETYFTTPVTYVAKWTSVNVDPTAHQPQNSSWYTVSGNSGNNTVSSDGTVFYVKYDRKTADITINHFYKATEWSVAGVKTEGEYPAEAQVSTTDSGFVGASYTADEELTYNQREYNFDHGTKTISALAANTVDESNNVVINNVINLYYDQTFDNRALASVTVNKYYETYGYVMQDTGRYSLENVTATPAPSTQATADSHATVKFDVAAAPDEGYESFTLDTTKGDYSSLTNEDGALSFILAEGDNVKNLYYKKTLQAPETVTLTIRHHYTKNVTTVIDGVVNHSTPVNNVVVTGTATHYVGETITVEEVNSYNSEAYVSATGNATSKTINSLSATNNVIDLYYTLDVEPATTNLTVNHVYRTITNETVTVTDENGQVTGTTVTPSTNIDNTVPVTVNALYVGQSYEADLRGEEGYTFNAAESTRTTNALADNASVLTLYYDKSENADNRSATSIDVKHVYTTHLTTVVNGEVTTIDVPVEVTDDAITTLKVGDSFTATPVTTYGGNTYTVVGSVPTARILQGTNSTVVINYERNDSDLVPTTYTVNYVYRTYEMKVVDGVAQEVLSKDKPEPVTLNGYVGQNVTIDNGAREGFTANNSNPSTTQTLTDGENNFTFKYVRHINNLQQATITVVHKYSTTTIAKNGTSTTDNTKVTDKYTKYVGETLTVEPVSNGFDISNVKVSDKDFSTSDASVVSGTVAGDTKVVFNYSKTIDNSVPATLIISHKYIVKDYFGNIVSESKAEETTINSFATVSLTANADIKDGYDLTSVTLTNKKGSSELSTSDAPAYTVKLKAGENKIEFVYTQVLKAPKVDITVIHNYYRNADDETPEYTYTVNDQKRVDKNYKAEKIENYQVSENEFIPYNFVSADPGLKIKVDVDPANNVITIKYVRADATYTINRVYTVNGVETASEQLDGHGKIGDVVTKDNFDTTVEYEGNTYTLVSADPASTTLDESGEQIITVVYNRNVIYYYGGNETPAEEESIPEEDVPQADLPSEEDPSTPAGEESIPDEEVALADAPSAVTGDATIIWVILMLSAGVSIIIIENDKKRNHHD